MKAVKKFVIVFFIFSFMLIIIPISVSAHTSNLGIDGDNDITFDDCDADNYVSSSDIGDGYNEKWYDLMWGKTDTSTTPDTFNYTVMYHIDDDINTVYYQFQDTGYDQSTTTWSTGVGEKIGNDVKTKFENSMLKWNNVFYYKLNSEGFYEKHRIINLVNFDSLEDKSGITPHILIYPYYSTGDFSAETSWNYSSEITSDTKTSNGIKHKHFTQFRMQVNTYFLSTSTALQNRTGAHELGHVLGLFDIDTTENPNQSSLFHHEEILMGYSKNNYSYSRQTEITYKDIAGVSITRGFHTNNDHLWLYDEDSPRDGKNKLICSLCNCVKYVEDLSSYNYYEYEQCGHSESSLSHTVDDNMIPVASYGNTDYYKCKYCRYVAPFTSRITQNYVYCGEHDDSKHILENSSGNLNYKISENHSLTVNLGGNNYKCSGCDYRVVNTFEEYSLSNYSSTINKTVNLSGNETKYYKINSNYNKYYEFMVDGTYGVDIKLFDENFNEILVDDLNDSNSIEHIINQLQVGTYYLEIKNSSSSTNSTSIKIVSRTTAYIGVGDNDILVNTYNNISSYVYGNSTGKGFYKITLSANTSSGVITYPESCIKVYKDSTKQELVTRLETIYYTLPANTSSSSNNLIVFLDQGSTYYIDIIIPNDIYSIVSLDIEKIEDTYEINMFNNIEGVYEEEVLLENDETQFGDYIQKIEIKQKGIYSISFIHDGPQSEASSNFLYYALYKELVGPPEEVGNVEMLLPHMTTTMGGTITYEFILDKGVYYIGYYNKFSYEPMSITIKYQIDIYDSNKIITDPDLLTDCGSMINIYEKNLSNKSYRGKTIVVGFTRILYLDPILEIDTRTDYSWYSSNEDIATVSEFGTVFAKSPGTVKIMAVNKEDLKIVYIETFTIINDNSTDSTERIININDTHSVSDGDYLVGLTVLNSPYPSAYLYDWEILSYDETITRIEYIGSGYFVIEGFGDVFIKGSNYAYNNKYSIKIYLNVTQ